MPGERCRICMSTGTLQNVFNRIGSVMLSTKIMTVAKVQIYPQDGLPDTICLKCIERLDICLEFIQQCESSDIKLRSKLKCLPRYYKIKNEQDYLNEEDSKENELLIVDNSNISANRKHSEPEIAVEEDNKDLIRKNFALTSKRKRIRKKSLKAQCSVCGKVMSSRFRLKTHLRTHTGERPYRCPHCDKKFTLEQSLKIHIRVHTGEKPLSCSICRATFAHTAGLTAHKRKHTGQMPYKCTLCTRTFRTPGHLQYHLRCHTGEKNFECDVCSRAFITRSDLKRHQLVHSGLRPHVCCVCGFKLRRASHLKRHMLTHNGDRAPSSNAVT